MKVPNFKIERSHLLFYFFISLFLGLFLAVETRNGRLWTNDFLVYYSAINDFFSGNNPYTSNYGLETGYFKYPPFTLYLFGYNYWLPFNIAKIIHLLLSSLALFYSIPVLANIIRQAKGISKKYTWTLYLCFFTIVIHIVREFHMGNVNLLLLGLFTFGLSHLKSNIIWRTVISWSIMIIIKPIMVLILLPLLFFSHWRHLFYIGLCGIFFFLFPLIHLGWDANITLWTNWFTAISEHGEYIVSYNSLRFLASDYFGINSEWGPSLTALFILLLLLFLFIRKRVGQEYLINWIVVFMAFIPNFFVTDTQHFLLSVPLIVFLLHELIIRKSIIPWIIFAVAFGLLSLNSSDLLGNKLSDLMYDSGMLGIGNLIFIGLYIFMFSTHQKTKHLSEPILSINN